MNNASDYLAGDDMIVALLADGGSEAATYAPGDRSLEAVLARFAELVVDGEIYAHSARFAAIDSNLIAGDRDVLRVAGYITDRGDRFDSVLTDLGAAFIAGVVAEHGCTCSARTHLIAGI